MNDNSTFLALRLRVLPRRHRIAHLQALIGLGPKEPLRCAQLLELLHAEASGVSDD